MSHLKRQKVPKSWPIHRKGTAYVVRSQGGIEKSLPLLIVLRDVLKIAQNRKEVKKAIYNKLILVNSKPAVDERAGVLLFDTLTIIPSNKNYRIEIDERGKFSVKEIVESESKKKVAKVVSKKMLKGKKIQLNLSDGRNYLSDIKCETGDSVIINLKDKKIEKCLQLKENVNAFAFAGKHSGIYGKVEKMEKEKKTVQLLTKDGKVNVLIKQIMVVE